MIQKGKFTLLEISEVAAWLKTQQVTRKITLVQNHHTWLPGYKQFKGDNHFKMQAGMEASQIQRGFAEIAQQFTTFPDGTVMTGRSLNTIPAGIKGANGTGICMEHIGNFDVGGDTMSPEHRNTIIQLNAILCKHFKLERNTDSIVYHHWWDLTTGKRTNGKGSTKSCPGTNFFGGNTVEAAKANFIPEVELAYTALSLAPKVAAPSRTVQVIASTLNVRSGPAQTNAVVKKLAKGAKVGIYAEKNGWCRIDPLQELWVSGKYLS